jgi:hypothetical protein
MAMGANSANTASRIKLRRMEWILLKEALESTLARSPQQSRRRSPLSSRTKIKLQNNIAS